MLLDHPARREEHATRHIMLTTRVIEGEPMRKPGTKRVRFRPKAIHVYIDQTNDQPPKVKLVGITGPVLDEDGVELDVNPVNAVYRRASSEGTGAPGWEDAAPWVGPWVRKRLHEIAAESWTITATQS